MNKDIIFQPIGHVFSPFDNLVGMPIQPLGAKDVKGHIEIREDLVEGLTDLDGFSHIILIYYLHENEDKATRLKVKPFMDVEERGVFSTRSPIRPNMIGLSIVELIEVDGPKVHIRGVDILNGTPLLDIKPYVAKFDAKKETRSGWLEKTANLSKTMKSDDRFVIK